jgi:hypothetical protein
MEQLKCVRPVVEGIGSIVLRQKVEVDGGGSWWCKVDGQG